MKTAITLAMALLSGAIFSIGLAMAGMLNPARVIGFLDVTCSWDPTLAFVLASAVVSYAAAFWLMSLTERPLVSTQFHLSASRSIDTPLIVGATTFGVGWGVSGYCPGPAIASLGLHASLTWIFVATMLVGMAIAGRLRGHSAASRGGYGSRSRRMQ